MAIPIGELKARLTAEATQMKQEIATVKKGISDLGEEGKKTSTALGGISTALGNLGKSKGMDDLPSAWDNLNARIDLQRKKLAQLKESYDSTFNEQKKNQLQEQILKTEASIIRMIASSDQMAQKMIEADNGLTAAGEAAKQSEVNFNALNNSLRQLGFSSDQIKKINTEMKNANPQLVQQQLKQVEAQLNAMGVDGKQALSMIKQEMEQVGQGSQQAVSKIDALDQSLKDIGLSAEQIKIVKRNLDTVDPTKAERQLEELSVVLKQLGVDSKHIEKINQELRETENESKRAGQGMQTLASGLTALGAGAATAKILSLTKTLSNEANQLANSYQGLAVVANKFNVDASAAADLAEKLADRWGLNIGTMADVVKTYTSMNLTLEETEKIIIATADAAAYNRQAHLTWDEAIKQVAEGIKAGNSNLTDAAGITTNLSVMQERYAKSLGTTAGKLTETGKIQAAYNGMLQEGAIFAGNADAAMTGYTGTQASFNTTIQEARVELGEAFLPVIDEILTKLTPMIRSFAEWSAANKDVVAGTTAAVATFTTLITVMTTAITVAAALKLAFDALKISIGPIGWAITIIGALVTGVTAYTAAANTASESALKFAQSQEALNAALAKTEGRLNGIQYGQMQEQVSALEEVMKRYNTLMKEYNEREHLAAIGEGSVENTHRLMELGDAIQAVTKELKGMGYTSAELAQSSLDSMNTKLEESLGALVDLTRQQQQANVQAVDAVNRLRDLSRQYDELNSLERLSEEQKSRLANIVRELKGEYPDLLTQLDEENRWHIANKDALDLYITGEENRVNAAIEASKRIIEAAKIEAQERARLLNLSIEKVKQTEVTYKPVIETESQWLFDNMLGNMQDKVVRNLQDELNQVNFEINESTKLLEDLKVGADAFRSPDGEGLFTTGNDKDKDKGKSKVKKTAEELAREDYQNSLKYIQYKRDLNQMSEQQEIAALERLQKRYSKYGEIRQDTEVRIYKIKEQLAADEEKLREKNQKDAEKLEKERFAASSEWITQEERRMVLAGKSEEEIAQMKLEAWSRVRSRYDKDSEYYKQADTQLYNLRVNIIKQQNKAEQDAAKERETLLKDTTKRTLDAIDKAKKAELAALDERRKAIQKFYDDQSQAIDDSERLKERNELISEMEKYRYATSEKGQKHFMELQEKLRKMDVEQQKRELDAQLDQELDALDQQKQDIEDYYNELREATSDLTGDLTELYKLADDERLKSFVKTNELIKQEMANLQQAIAASQSSSSSTGVTQSIVAQMQANSAAWHTADTAGKKRLEADNQSLGAQIGATYKNGRWLLDGTPIYHSGGIAGEMNFRSPNELMPDEITAILKRGEPVLTPQQIGSLVSAGNNSKPASVVNNYNAPLIEHSGDVILEDQADIKSYHSEQSTVAQQLLAKGERAV